MTDSADQILNDLRTRYRSVPVLTLAQTALWDDGIKAIFKGLIDDHAPGTRLILGVMDTDYFSRLPSPPSGAEPFELLAHNDGSTRDLWSAVGEMSALFGAETPVPLAAHGVNVPKAARGSRQDAAAFLDTISEAWGWRGIAQTQGRRSLAGDVPLRAVAEPLARQIDWALKETSVVSNRAVGRYAGTLIGEADHFVRRHPDGSLADLYLHLLPGMYTTLLGYEPRGLEYTKSSELLAFNGRTANRVRFRPLDLFLDPSTAPIARKHYNDAVRDSGIATLDRFGEEAIPFELAIPGKGRGTLHIGPREIRVDTDEPIVISLDAPVTDRRHLAAVLERELGGGIALLGKAVVLITMLAGEYIFLFNETGSPYVRNSCRWNVLLAGDSLGLNLYPILRLGAKPLDTIGAAGGDFHLPEHLAWAFGNETVSAMHVQENWQAAAKRGEDALAAIARFHKPSAWLDHLATESDGVWTARAEEYSRLREQRAEHGRAIAAVNAEGGALLQELRNVRVAVDTMEVEKGAHWRTCIQPLRERQWQARHGAAENTNEIEEALKTAMEGRQGMESQIEARRAEISRLVARRQEVAERRRAILSDPEVAAREARQAELEDQAELEKATRVRNATMSREALHHIQPRPSAWWFPVVDPSGAWFQATAETADFRWQTLTGGACSEPLPLTISADAVLTI